MARDLLLAINVGNSYMTLGCYEDKNLIISSHLATELKHTADQYAVQLNVLLHLYNINPEDIKSAIISSVVPELTVIVQKAIYIITGRTALIVGPGVKSGLNILIDNPAQLGADLVAGAVAAIAKYPLPCIVFYLETATTMSIIDKKGNFRGVIISAGIGTSLEALTSRTALLTRVSIETPPSVIGRNSVHSMQSGLVYGTACMIEGLASKIEQELKEPATLVASGQFAAEITKNCQRHIAVDNHLVLEGLSLIYRKNIIN